jgi:mannose-6-phosphate isomerase class I
MKNIIKPYLIIPKFIPQPTWGGDYIIKFKNWENKFEHINRKIGQSYELFGLSKLFTVSDSSYDSHFQPEVGNAQTTDTDLSRFKLRVSQDFLNLSDLIKADPEGILGPEVYKKFGKMHILIKFTQALGNSFQLHIKPDLANDRWIPKAESWYFFEKGYISFGVKPKLVSDYQKVCKEIEAYMIHISHKFKHGDVSLDEARIKAKTFITKLNPWKFVNLCKVNKYDVLDLSAGGLHHSWEENLTESPIGNVIYEVQEDVMDPSCTIRSFDQGKLTDTGDIRSINIDDYFKYLDSNPLANDPNNIKSSVYGNVFHNPKYCMDKILIHSKMLMTIDKSYEHIFVLDGNIVIKSGSGDINIGRGHSCFIPYATKQYEIISKNEKSIILKTYLDGGLL